VLVVAKVMTNQPGQFEELMRQVGNGSEDAVRILLDEYGEHICRAVRRRLHRSFRSKFDPEDVEQSVWAVFFGKPSRTAEFSRPESLIAFLISVAQNKVRDKSDDFATRKRDLSLEEQIDDSRGNVIDIIHKGQPTPSETVMVRERWDALRRAKPEHHVRIIELRAAGYSIDEIAESVKLHERSVRRVLENLVDEVSANDRPAASS